MTRFTHQKVRGYGLLVTVVFFELSPTTYNLSPGFAGGKIRG